MGKILYCSNCRQDRDESEFTKFSRNPALKDRGGKVVICKDCCSAMVEEQGNNKESLKNVLRLVDIPYIEKYADLAFEVLDKKKKNTNIIIKQNVYDNTETIEGIEGSTIQTTIYSCYTARLGIMPKKYINFSCSDGVRDDSVPVKEEPKPEVNLKDKEVVASVNYLKKLFGDKVFDNREHLAKSIKLKMEELGLYKNDNAKRQQKFKLKNHALNLIEADILTESDLEFLFDKAEEVEKQEVENLDEIPEIKEFNSYDIDYLQDKWGFGYKKSMLIAFEKKYQTLKNNYPEKTALHTEALLTYIRYRVNEEFATALGDVKSAKEWGMLAEKQANNAKINISQLSKSDLSDGLDSFGTLVKMVETAVDIIEILPSFRRKPQDDVDFTMYSYINYVRDLKGLPPCKYEEIYGFFDARKAEYEHRFTSEEESETLEGDENGNL